MRREYSALVETSPPAVAYRESITQRVDYDYTHKKQTGGAGQYGRVVGIIEPYDGEIAVEAIVSKRGACKSSREVPGSGYRFIDNIIGGTIPREYIPAVDKGFESMLQKGPRIGAPMRGVS